MEHFFSLTPDRVLDSVERLTAPRFGCRATGVCVALNSLENRVYELELDDGKRLVAKFYRPNRWNREALLEEHAFVAELAALEIPVVPALPFPDGSSVGQTDDGIFFAVYPKMRGRAPEELVGDQPARLGRLIARMHDAGAARPALHRRHLTPRAWGQESLAFLESGHWIDPQAKSRYVSAAQRILALVTPWFDGVPVQRIHGDCHLGNILWNSDGPFFLDFDDMCMGPSVQDLWLVIGGRGKADLESREALVGAYAQHRPFDRATLRLAEPLRALRIIHYSAWIARRWDDPSFKSTFPHFGTYKYWAEEAEALETVFEEIGGWPG